MATLDSPSADGIGRQNAPMRIAVVGCGPKGFYALESLCTLTGREARPPHFDVTVYEPTGLPGAGAIYDPSQPDFLRMNFASRFIDAWDRTISPPSPERPSLVDWLQQRCPEEADPGGFVPRAMVGRYLGECMTEAMASRPDCVRVKFCFEPVRMIRRRRDFWHVGSPNGAGEFDEVLITTGHQDWQRQHATADAASIKSIFPVTRRLDMDAVPPGSVVGCKGFALTWIDAALALTVGRGGSIRDREGVPQYQPSGGEPARLLPLSRTGRPMLCKPDYRCFSSPAPDGLWEERSAAILAPSAGPAGSFRFVTDIWPEILRAADQALNLADGTAQHWFETWRLHPFDGARAYSEMRSSYRVATGRAEPDIPWALGEAWRRTYPAVVACVSHGGLSARNWPEFAAIALEMERIACGPPTVNMGCMLALIEAGLIDLSQVDHFADIENDEWPMGIDIRVDATIPPPALFDPEGPIDGLLRDGHAARGPGGGLVVDASGQALMHGAPTRGLSVLGRPTEGCVLGNDTLNRVLHRHPVRWAERMLQRASSDAHRLHQCLAVTA